MSRSRPLTIYGCQADRDAGVRRRPPRAQDQQGTIWLRPEDAAAIPDDEFSDLVRAALEP
jgi:hypothetical protein